MYVLRVGKLCYKSWEIMVYELGVYVLRVDIYVIRVGKLFFRWRLRVTVRRVPRSVVWRMPPRGRVAPAVYLTRTVWHMPRGIVWRMPPRCRPAQANAIMANASPHKAPRKRKHRVLIVGKSHWDITL